MRKITDKKQLVLYACSGLGVNMLNIIMGSYLCSALLTGGFDKHIESWTYLNKDLVVAWLWSAMVFVAKAIDGVIDIPFSAFADNIKSKFGRRKTGILMGFIPMLVAYCLFLVPPQNGATVLNTVYFALLLVVFYSTYTLTMITYYATFAEITADNKALVLVSNTKSICDVVYFSLGFALVPAFVSMGINIRIVALMFLPLALTMLIPLFLLKEGGAQAECDTEKRVTHKQSLNITLQNSDFIKWLCVLFVMNFGLQLFLSGINEFFSSAGLNMTVIMATCFVPVPATIFLYNRILKKRGLGFAYRYVLIMFATGMLLMSLCDVLPERFLLPLALFCSLLISFSIGAFFSVTYTVPSHIAKHCRGTHDGDSTSTMFFAIQGLFEGVSAGIASGIVLVFLKQHGLIRYMTLIVAGSVLAALALSFFLPRSVTVIGKEEE